ncbi:gamma-secretase subunit APH-1A-like isoform X2 [Anguilla rostrata]|uniref:gamma-secretase subunit APH-1A-like isoform X2 n=1 Tax=Anguilla anguilla TaxID=7936 RepID=UPI0015AA1B99|nr:gamma-secretase subunit APH-1A-like isoform X2 [Anguilla anguilla]
MGLAVFFGCSFITFGPAFALLMFTVTDSPVRVIILVVGASLWLVGLVLSSLMWYALVSLCGGSDPNLQLQLLAAVAAVAVFIQEALRAASYKLLRFFSHETTHAALASFVVKGGPTLSLQQKAFVSGLAFGLMSSAFSFANILSVSLGPGIVGIHGESSHFFITSAFQAMMQSGLQVCWSVLLFSACERRSWARGVAVVLSHLLSCGLSFLNPRYCLSLLLQSVLLVAVVMWSWVEAGGRGCPCLLRIGGRPLTKVEAVQYSALRSPVEH